MTDRYRGPIEDEAPLSELVGRLARSARRLAIACILLGLTVIALTLTVLLHG